MKYASAFSGIGTDHIAWAPLGWECAWFAETDKFPSEVLRQRFPDVPNLGDVTEIGAEHGPVDLLVGGPPCQSFSIAGKRKGMDDPRGNLALEFLALADRLRARWFVFENVPGLLSSNGGRDFARFLRAVSEHGYCACWRILDAQNFGVPQRRRRVFLVGYLGDWRPAAAVLLERDCLRGNTAKGKKSGAEIAGTLEARAATGGYDPGAHGAASEHLVPLSISMRTRDGEPQLEFSETQSALRGSNGGSSRSFVYAPQQYRQDSIYPINRPANALAASRTRIMQSYDTAYGIRRLTPVECERLQGLPFITNYCIIRVWSTEQRKKNALAAEKNPKSPRYVGNVGSDTLPQTVPSAISDFPPNDLSSNRPVAVNVHLDLEAGALALHNLENKNWSANGAERLDSYPLLVPKDVFVRVLALMPRILASEVIYGKAELQQSRTHFSDQKNGKKLVHMCGQEIDGSVEDAEEFINTVSESLKFTISGAGSTSQSCDTIWKTWSCYVVNAICSFIPDSIRNANSFDVKVEATIGHTQIAWRGKPPDKCPDGPRYRAIGNGMAMPVLRWVGERIQLVEDMKNEK